jgi:hypothetical protein
MFTEVTWNNQLKKGKVGGHQRLTPVILATQEAEIRRISGSEIRMAQSQPKKIVHEILSQKKTHHKKGLVEWLKV